ncbi:MAG: NUDIX hydrolase, partial [Lachnospiraceae bacterium]|nr:NUDIX hydrolase [Lachnospiraceae bacterium]
ERLVLIRQFRYPIGDYIYERPAGLIDEGETPDIAAIREYKEETGLTFKPLSLDFAITKPFYTTVGMTDESVASAFGYAVGTPSLKGLEENEDITVILADKDEVRRILKEEKVAVKCAYLMLHFLNSKKGDPFAFLKAFLL